MRIKKKKRIPSVVMYGINVIMLLIPWLTVGERKLNLFQFAFKFMNVGIDGIMQEAGITYYEAAQLQVGIVMELGLFAIAALASIIYLALMISGRKTNLNILNIVAGVVIVYLHMSGVSLRAFTISMMDTGLPIVRLLISGLEFLVREFTLRWEETVADVVKQKEQEEAFKKEVEERLHFEGKYTKMFYQYVWKNFKRNWKDYTLLLFSNILIFGSLVVGIGMKDILALENTTKGTQLFNGLNRILVNAMIPMAIIAVFIFVLLFFHYVKCRARNFGVFLTLGMRRNLLYRFVAIEYISMLIIAMLTGAILGTGVLSVFANNSVKYVGIEVPMSAIGIPTYAKAIAILLAICLISLMAAKEIFTDFNVGKSTDLRAMGEKIPQHFRKSFVVIGCMLVGLSIFRYINLDNFENVTLLLVFFVGMFLVIRYGMADYLVGQRKSPKYLNKLLKQNQLFHKSKTNTGYIGAFFVMNFCILFYFMFQVMAANISEDVESLFPYDIVCLADENDNDILGKIRESYEIDWMEYPALRVSSYDSTEQKENTRSGAKPIQGQHIGISESTYHELKKRLDPDYEAKDLNLDAEGEYIHIVYQQDKSEHAKPIGFFAPRSKPALHIGQPCRGVDIFQIKRTNIGYAYYQVRSEEIGTLIGTFRQGMKENIVVFSDEYFEKAKDFWKTTDIYSGRQLNDDEIIPEVNVHQGITRLVLMDTEDKNLPAIDKMLQKLEERHLKEERKLFEKYFLGKGVYDYSVSYYYMKDTAIKNLQTERLMKITMNSLLILVFFFMNILLLIIKMLSELELNRKRTDFFNCMGMRKKERIRLMRKELLSHYYLIPSGAAAVFSIAYTACAIHARMYTSVDIKAVLGSMIPLWAGYFILSTVVMWIITTIYVYRMEGKRNGRSS